LVGGQFAGREAYKLDYICVTSGSKTVPTATVRLLHKDKISLQDSGTGDGAVDAAMKTIDRLTGVHGNLVEYAVRATTEGKDAMGEVTIKVDFGDGELVTGKGASTDVIEASARAYLNAVNRHVFESPAKKGKKKIVNPQP